MPIDLFLRLKVSPASVSSMAVTDLGPNCRFKTNAVAFFSSEPRLPLLAGRQAVQSSRVWHCLPARRRTGMMAEVPRGRQAVAIGSLGLRLRRLLGRVHTTPESSGQFVALPRNNTTGIDLSPILHFEYSPTAAEGLSMQVEIADLDKVMRSLYSHMQPDEPAEAVYPLLHATGRVGCGFTWPAHDLRHLLCWIWLCWHKHHCLERIAEVANPVLTRALSFYSMGITQGMRTEHDSWILHAAILGSRWDLARQAAKVVAIADPENPSYQCMHAWTGILKYMIEQDEADAQIQANIFHKFKPNRVFARPRPKLVTAFMERDSKSFKKQLRDASKFHWTIAEKEKVIAQATPDSATLMLEKKHNHFFWPWVEAVLLKLALKRGMEIQYDDFWLPLGLIGAGFE